LFLHIGNSKVVNLNELIGIFNVEMKNSNTNIQFLESFPGDHVSSLEQEESNSFVLTKSKILYSPISPLTLQKRIEKNIQE